MPKVSIVLPTYNGEKYIRESIDSVLAQTFNDWELIIVNDCSTDSTPEIAEHYAKLDNRIKVIHNTVNQKLPASLNIGFREARGKYLTWTSDDNNYYVNALEVMNQYLDENTEVYMVCADMLLVDSEGNEQQYWHTYDEEKMFINNCVGACFLYSRQVLEDVGEYDERKFLIEDYDYWLKILKRYGKIGYIDQCLYAYRFHENSLTATRRKKIKEQLLNLRKSNLEWILGNLRNEREITRLYLDFLLAGLKIGKSGTEILDKIPALSIVQAEVKPGKNYIIYGAGAYGEKAAELLGERVICFADSDDRKVGMIKCDKKIISVAELRQRYRNYNIVVAVSEEKILDVLKYLYINGIQECLVFEQLEHLE